MVGARGGSTLLLLWDGAIRLWGGATHSRSAVQLDFITVLSTNSTSYLSCKLHYTRPPASPFFGIPPIYEAAKFYE